MSKKKLIVFRYGDRDLPSVTAQLSIVVWVIINSWNTISPNSYLVMIAAQDWYYPQDADDDRDEYRIDVVQWLSDNQIQWDKMQYINRAGQSSILTFLLHNEADAARFKLAFG